MVCLRSLQKPQGAKGGIFMLEQYAIVTCGAQAQEKRAKLAFDPKELSEYLGRSFLCFLEPLMRQLHTQMDLRPVRTLAQTVEAILAFRDRCNGLLLSELGDYLDGVRVGGGGTKRMSTLVHHQSWQAGQIEEFLLARADQAKEQWEKQAEEGLVIWD